MVYLIHWNTKTGFRVNAKMERDNVAHFLEFMESYEFIEVGPVTYWLMRHGFPRLAMLPFWR